MPTVKTRFLILQDNVEKQLFSVEERKNCDLVIGLTPPSNASFQGSSLGIPTSRKISVHLSQKSDPPSHTITHEIGFPLRLSHKGYAKVIKTPGDPFLWPIYIQALGTNEKAFILKNQKDECRRITAYSSLCDTFIYCVCVTHNDFIFPKSHGTSVTTKEFGKFSVHVISAFADVRSISSTIEAFHYTSAVRDGGYFATIGGSKSAPTFTIQNFEQYLMLNFLQIAQTVARKGNPLLMLPLNGNIQLRRFARYTSGISIEEGLYGEHAVFLAPRHAPGLRMDPNESQKAAFSNQSEPSSFVIRR